MSEVSGGREAATPVTPLACAGVDFFRHTLPFVSLKAQPHTDRAADATIPAAFHVTSHPCLRSCTLHATLSCPVVQLFPAQGSW